MFDFNLKKIGHGINFIQYKIGELFFPILEPFFRMLESQNPEIRQHIDQAEISLGRNNLSVALLNLNKVLSLRPKHFLARVYRGRIHIYENQHRLAAEDYAQASEISRYRFIHYDLYREYFSSLGKETEPLNVPLAKDFTQAFKTLPFDKERFSNDSNTEWDPGFFSEIMNDEEMDEEDSIFPGEDQSKFRDLSPITRKEIQETDWEKLIRKLSSKPNDD